MAVKRPILSSILDSKAAIGEQGLKLLCLDWFFEVFWVNMFKYSLRVILRVEVM
ncbi:Hypothetical predicted protein [Paramuricea clavata]|uniref:Uncharacterized protein n=1 Tax=Paramuricea clavata TaxID=317549 RepID=A0A6S7GET8_PARCT|nr:Hypothetical predicted protein [Paramuricea clavata]